MMTAARGGAWDVCCQRFQRRWIDRLTAIQVGGSPAGDELPESSLELVVGGERFFFLRKFPKNLPFFYFYQS